jgi:6-phosphogluconolactonase
MKKRKENKVNVFRSVDELNLAAAQLLLDIAEKAVRERDRFFLCLSGGNTPKSLYSLLSLNPYRDLVPWKKTFVFWGDERCVPAEDERNNAHMATTVLLDKTDIPSSHIFPVPVNLSPHNAARKYEKVLHTFFGEAAPGFDLILLGLGVNGHTASLFPDTDVLQEKNSWVKEVCLADQQEYRITMTVTLINKSQNILFMVTGKEKADILYHVLTAPYNPANYPAQLISPENGKIFWFIDENANCYKG